MIICKGASVDASFFGRYGMIRLATERDIESITKIYDEIHTQEEAGILTIGWIRGVYPTRETVVEAVRLEEMYVCEDKQGVVAAAKINKKQEVGYRKVNWEIKAETEKVLVIHTLVVRPASSGKGYAKSFIDFYNEMAKKKGCTVLRLDTNEKNLRARRMYGALGFKESGIISCTFNGIEGVKLVCLERKVLR